MNKYVFIVVLVFSCAIMNSASVSEETVDSSSAQKSVRVLFIGNSLVASNNLPQIFKTIAEHSGKKIKVDSTTRGGATFKDHWEAGNAAAKLRENKYNVVILQNQSIAAANNHEQMISYAKKFSNLIDLKKSRKILFLSMPYSDETAARYTHNNQTLTSEKMFELLEKGYVDTAKAIKGEVTPAGLACQLALQEDPSLKLLSTDGMHTSKLGSTLIAMVIYQTIFDEAAKIKKEQLGVDITDEQFEQLQKIMLKAIKQFDEKFPELKEKVKVSEEET